MEESVGSEALDLSSLKDYELGANMRGYLDQVGFLNPEELVHKKDQSWSRVQGADEGTPATSGIREMIDQMQRWASRD